jgi:hypothetical protein
MPIIYAILLRKKKKKKILHGKSYSSGGKIYYRQYDRATTFYSTLGYSLHGNIFRKFCHLAPTTNSLLISPVTMRHQNI